MQPTVPPVPSPPQSGSGVAGEPARTLPGPEKRPRWLANLALSCLVLGPLLLFWFSQLGRWFFLAEMLVNFQAQILVLMTPGVLAALFWKRWRLAIPAVLSLGFGLTTLVPVWMPAGSPTTGTRQLRLMSFNVLGSNSGTASVLAEIAKADPDILVVVELTDQWAKVLETGLGGGLQPVVVLPRLFGNGIGLYTRLPVRAATHFPLAREFSDYPATDVELDVDGVPLRIIGVHFISPITLQGRRVWNVWKGSRQRLNLRNLQMLDAAQRLEGNRIPAIMAGDFNCTPYSGFFRELLRMTRLRDSRQGAGLQGSFPASPWWLRIPIDHVLASTEIRIHSRQTGSACGSDHLPVIVDFSLPGGQTDAGPAR